MTRDEWLAELRASDKVSFVSEFADGRIFAHTRDGDLVRALRQRGARAMWFDRTRWATLWDGAEPDMQAEVILGSRCWDEQ